MVVYIRQSKLPSEVSINKYNAQVGAYLQGEEVIFISIFFWNRTVNKWRNSCRLYNGD